MKKTFNLTASNKSTERHLDDIRHEIKKYIARERRKTLPEKYDYWDFDCRIGNNAQDASTVHVAEINEAIMKIVSFKKESFYLEILSKACVRTKK